MASFKNTHTNSDENLLGWNNRIIYLFSTPEVINVGAGSEIFSVISNSWKKGTNILPQNYFNCDDGRTFKISMYFLSELDGTDFRLNTGILDENDIEYSVPTKDNHLHKKPNISEFKLFKYECILTKWYDPTAGDTKINVNGYVTYSGYPIIANDDVDVKFIQINGFIAINASIIPKIIINNTGTSNIMIKSIIIEEIK